MTSRLSQTISDDQDGEEVTTTRRETDIKMNFSNHNKDYQPVDNFKMKR